MNHKLTLVTMSLLSIALSTFHITDDIVRGIETVALALDARQCVIA